jgi:hypothetical protein
MSVGYTWLSLCALLACSRDVTPSPQPISKPAARPVDTNACVTRSDDRDPSRADSIAIAGDVARFCFGAHPRRSCWRVDVSTQVFEQLATTPDVAEHVPRFAGEPHAKTKVRDDGTIELCGPGGSPCKSFRYRREIAFREAVAASDDLSTVTIPDTVVVPDKPRLRVYDVATAKLRATINGWPPPDLDGGQFRSPPIFATRDRMIVWDAWTPVSDQGRIFDMSGKQIAIIGDDFSVIEPETSSWRLAGTEWAFAGFNMILTIDVEDPNVTSTRDVSALLALPRPPKDLDTRSLDILAIAGTAKRLIIVTGENPVTVGVLDRATNKLVKLEPPRCPSASQRWWRPMGTPHTSE